MLNKTKKMMVGVLSVSLVTLTACGDDRPAEPTGYDCDDWEWDKDTGTYYCDDDDSTYARSYYHGGSMYKSKNELKNSSNYQTYYSNYKSGIGSGTKGGFGG
ncbi:hypothetical protein SAMN05880501_10440 [Ureibacillus xyleni]|uniref:Aminotransferase yhxA n=1 Tax=Ureibacillus xyleni TaxID=614648 RepID=A0A285SH60_9BACL|nr:hypothetical protein [Ureibacillus xyleni]SOC05302.1 hypothetical protein SAMN05880501_10440 [Ureibacillus xyleni]